jgi:ABC-type branched-subunit amino acid transport system ATPase component
MQSTYEGGREHAHLIKSGRYNNQTHDILLRPKSVISPKQLYLKRMGQWHSFQHTNQIQNASVWECSLNIANIAVQKMYCSHWNKVSQIWGSEEDKLKWEYTGPL